MRDVFFVAAISLGLPAVGYLNGYTTLACFGLFEVSVCVCVCTYVCVYIYIYTYE